MGNWCEVVKIRPSVLALAFLAERKLRLVIGLYKKQFTYIIINVGVELFLGPKGCVSMGRIVFHLKSIAI